MHVLLLSRTGKSNCKDRRSGSREDRHLLQLLRLCSRKKKKEKDNSDVTTDDPGNSKIPTGETAPSPVRAVTQHAPLDTKQPKPTSVTRCTYITLFATRSASEVCGLYGELVWTRRFAWMYIRRLTYARVYVY